MGRRLRVLIVDDEPMILRSTALLLGEGAHEVHTHEDARTILDAVRALRPDVVLQDVRMPGLDLPRVLDDIRRDARLAHVHVVLFSADIGGADLAEDLGVALVEKPFRPHELAEAIERAVEGSPARG